VFVFVCSLKFALDLQYSKGPPPDLAKRKLIFDSLQKIISSNYESKNRQSALEPNRGTCVFSWGAGYRGQLGFEIDPPLKKYSSEDDRSKSPPGTGREGKKKRYSTVPQLVKFDSASIRKVNTSANCLYN
jgi:hypothetical protein